MAKNLFKLRKNQRFYYAPRFYKGIKEGNIYEVKSKFDLKDRELNYNDFKGQWSKARNASRTRDNSGVNKRLLIIIGVLILIVLYIFDFDFSVFNRR